MDFKTYFSELSAAQKRNLAADCETTVEYFFQISGGHSEPSPKLALKIESATRGLVSRQELRPDIYPKESAA